MDKIIWLEEFSVGDGALNSQHMYIIDLINRLIDCQNNGVSAQEISSIMSEISDYSRYHLEYEESLLQEINYSEFTEHKALHLKYLEKTQDYSLKSYNSSSEVTSEILVFLKDWWLNHILVEDMKYKSVIKK